MDIGYPPICACTHEPCAIKTFEVAQRCSCTKSRRFSVSLKAEELKKQKDRLKRAARKTPMLMSGVTGEGVKDALRALIEVIGEAPVSTKAKGAAEPWAATP